MATIRERYRWLAAQLRERGEPDPLFTAERLLRKVLKWSRERLFLGWEERLSPEQERRLETAMKRRLAGEPLQYIIGRQAFYGRDFVVTPDVLIPRPETEEVVSLVLREGRRRFPQSPHVVDVGTGSGAIAVTLALEEPAWQVSATDQSSAALAVAKQNAAIYGLAEEITWWQGDLLAPLLQAAVFPQIIVSNPPYVATEDYLALERQVRDFEPRLALDGGADGLVFYRRLQQQLQHWKEPCLVVFEIGYDQADALIQCFTPLADRGQVHLEQDLGGRDRILWFTRHFTE